MATVRRPTPWPILLISPPKIMLQKIPLYRNTHHDPARDTVERRGAVVGVHLVGGSLLHDERAIVIYLEGDATIIRSNSTVAAVSFLFLHIFEYIF